jgi:hypothetical protein
MAEFLQYERRLRQQVRAFLRSGGPHQAILSALSEWRKLEWRPYLFGGLLRDIFVLGMKQGPRDIDVVVTNGSSEDLAHALHPYIRRRTRFGGFQLELNRWHFDIWPLESTWAFVTDKHLAATPENLPKTTFLNVEAVAVSLSGRGRVDRIYENGFFDAVRTRTLDINFEPNPYPALAAVRALATATKLGFSLSVRLATYIIKVEESLGSEALVLAQDSHYGFVRFRRAAIASNLRHIERELSRTQDQPVLLPETQRQQLPLWH